MARFFSVLLINLFVKNECNKVLMLVCINHFFFTVPNLYAQYFAKDNIENLIAKKGSAIERIQFLNTIGV